MGLLAHPFCWEEGGAVDLIAMMATLWTFARVATEVNNGGGGGVVIDLLNLQWWQSIIAIIGVMGLSPAPWILGLATNKIQFTAVAQASYDKRVAELNEYHDALTARADQRYADLDASWLKRYNDLEATAQKNEQAVQLERERANAATAALAESTDVARMATHVIQEMRQAAQEVSPDGH